MQTFTVLNIFLYLVVKFLRSTLMSHFKFWFNTWGVLLRTEVVWVMVVPVLVVLVELSRLSRTDLQFHFHAATVPLKNILDLPTHCFSALAFV